MPDTPSPASVDAPRAGTSSTTPGEAPADQDGWRGGPGVGGGTDLPGGLPALRAELDRIDNAIHALLIERAGVVEHVARSGKPAAFRPGREAAIIRRLLAQHQGQLPRLALCRIWREMLAGTTRMQGPFTVGVGGAHPDLTALAREHFGALTALQGHATAGPALQALRAGTVTVAVVPYPVAVDPRVVDPDIAEAWWPSLLGGEPRLHVIARLPFWGAPRPDGAPASDALVVATTPPDPSGQDRSFVAFEADGDASPVQVAAALRAAGLVDPILTAPIQGRGLADVADHLTDDDPRLGALVSVVRRPVVVGGYAVPIGSAA